MQFHPGGKKILLNNCGKNATTEFLQFHKETLIDKYKKFEIGKLKDVKKKEIVLSKNFGGDTPYIEPSWYVGFKSVYYKDSHIRLRNEVRKWVEKGFSFY